MNCPTTRPFALGSVRGVYAPIELSTSGRMIIDGPSGAEVLLHSLQALENRDEANMLVSFSNTFAQELSRVGGPRLPEHGVASTDTSPVPTLTWRASGWHDQICRSKFRSLCSDLLHGTQHTAARAFF